VAAREEKMLQYEKKPGNKRNRYTLWKKCVSKRREANIEIEEIKLCKKNI